MATRATKRDGEWVVIDSDGGTWTPDEEAQAEIATAEDAVAMCLATPMRGRWQD